ncbi:aminotransferase class I/II-fold pyridoxal phosphate-dependent enzyme [Myxococcota bacterium]|nr:aminotransferase class I/II-fold pyridoxal phosphate-dependent enzyme [Myxococcota bacterium]
MTSPELSTRVASLAPSIIREMFGRRRPTSIDLSLGEPALPTESDLLDTAVANLKDGPQGYTENAGLLALRTAIARYYEFPDKSGPENAIVTVGSEEAVFLAMISTLDPGDEVLVPEPGYPAYRNIATLIGAKSVSYPLTRETGLVARASAIAERITPKTRLLVLNGPSNPFGTVDSKEELEAIAALVERHGLWVLSDEIYRDLVYGAWPPPSICTMTTRSIFVSGLSKSASMTGLRLGYLLASAAQVKKMTLAHQLLVTCASRVAQLAAIEVFREPERRLRAHVPYYEAARAALAEVQKELPDDAPLFVGDGAFYAILDVSAYANGDPMALAIELLEKEDVVAVPGIAFGPSGAWFWRLSYAAGATSAGEGLRRIARFLRAKRT